MRAKTRVNEADILSVASSDKTATDISLETGYGIGIVLRVCKKHNIQLKKGKCGGKNYKDISGMKFHDMVVVDRADSLKRGSNNLACWNCICPCGESFVAVGADIRQGKIKTCGCRTSIKSRRNWQGYEEIGKNYWSSLHHNAEQRSLDLSISIEYAWSVFLAQGKRCSLSGVSISFAEKTASLDRIDNSLGYVDGNVQWVHKTVNKIKQTLDNEEFIVWCNRIANENRRII